jgi:hypothetical protein
MINYALKSAVYLQMSSRSAIDSGMGPITQPNTLEDSMRSKTDGILESSLYVSDVARSVRFYQEIFGFYVSSEFGERGCAMHAGPRQVPLLFKKGASRTISSPHDGDGALHAAIAIPGDELPNWESWLQQRGIAAVVVRVLKIRGVGNRHDCSSDYSDVSIADQITSYLPTSRFYRQVVVRLKNVHDQVGSMSELS